MDPSEVELRGMFDISVLQSDEGYIRLVYLRRTRSLKVTCLTVRSVRLPISRRCQNYPEWRYRAAAPVSHGYTPQEDGIAPNRHPDVAVRR